MKSSGRGRWLTVPLAFHALAAPVIGLQAVAGGIGALASHVIVDPRGLVQSDNQPFDPSLHPTTFGYGCEIAIASIAPIAVGLLLRPILRRAGSPAPGAAMLALDGIVVGAIALVVIDGAIRDNQPRGCCTGPGIGVTWWYVWAVASIMVTLGSLLASAWSLRRG